MILRRGFYPKPKKDLSSMNAFILNQTDSWGIKSSTFAFFLKKFYDKVFISSF